MKHHANKHEKQLNSQDEKLQEYESNLKLLI